MDTNQTHSEQQAKEYEGQSTAQEMMENVNDDKRSSYSNI